MKRLHKARDNWTLMTWGHCLTPSLHNLKQGGGNSLYHVEIGKIKIQILQNMGGFGARDMPYFRSIIKFTVFPIQSNLEKFRMLFTLYNSLANRIYNGEREEDLLTAPSRDCDYEYLIYIKKINSEEL
jgi:hypothetical protein